MSAASTLQTFLNQPLTTLRGVGTFYAKRLANLNLRTYRDLLFYFPRRLVIFQPNVSLARGEKMKGLWTVRPLQIKTTPKTCQIIAQLETPALETPDLDSPTFHLIFHPRQRASLQKQLQAASLWHVWGDAQHHDDGLVTLFFPRIAPYAATRHHVIEAVYSEVNGLSSAKLQTWIHSLLHALPTLPRLYPKAPCCKTLLQIRHGVVYADEKTLDAAKSQLAFVVAWAKQLFFEEERQVRATLPAHAMGGDSDDVKTLLHAQGWTLSPSQEHALNEIAHDLKRALPMRRLLQGDVGSGKTLVALSALWQVVRQGYAGAFLAPTTLLAGQVFQIWETLFAQTAGVTGALLTAQTPRKKALLKSLTGGEIPLVIGTHALLSPNVSLQNLALLIIDEQQRFGVMQRLHLTDPQAKGAPHPHVLLMTATPIPRTQQLQENGSLDASYLALRQASKRTTYVMSQKKWDVLAHKLKHHVDQGGKAFWVCPAIEKKTQRAAVMDRLETLRPFFHDKAQALYGDLPSTQQQDLIARFKTGEVRVLVATSVIETGLDVPDADWMVIEDAPLFGLTALHQLRGRIGRQGQPATLIALYQEPLSPGGRSRLRAFKTCEDGFDLARHDLDLRGGGNLWGTQQSGEDMEDAWLDPQDLEHAQQLARQLMQQQDWRNERLPWVHLLFGARAAPSSHLLQAG